MKATSKLFLTSFFALLATLDLAVGLIFSVSSHWLSWMVFLLISIFNVGLAYEIIQTIFSVFLKPSDPPQLTNLIRKPPVAILYLTRDDVIPEVLAHLKEQTYINSKVFVLDDSSNKRYQSLVDKSGFEVVRRRSHNAFKAGNLNHWLKLYGDRFPYFIELDNDSRIPPDFVDQLVRYAEHPENQNTAIFQSKVFLSGEELPFSKALEASFPFRYFLLDHLGNHFNTVMPTNNFLARTTAIQAIDGFATFSVTEDWATGIELLKHGHSCKLVNVKSTTPASRSAYEHSQRLKRWGSGLLQIVLSNIDEIPFTTHLRVFVGLLDYLIRPLQILGLLLLIWGTASNTQDISLFVHLLMSGYFFQPPLVFWIIVVGSYIGYLFIIRPLIAKSLGIKFSDYLQHILLWSAMHLYTLLPMSFALLNTMVGHKPTFEIVNSDPKEETSLGRIKNIIGPLIVLVFIVAGLLRNPLFFLFNWMWVTPILISPVVLYYFQSSSYHPKQLPWRE